MQGLSLSPSLFLSLSCCLSPSFSPSPWAAVVPALGGSSRGAFAGGFRRWGLRWAWLAFACGPCGGRVLSGGLYRGLWGFRVGVRPSWGLWVGAGRARCCSSCWGFLAGLSRGLLSGAGMNAALLFSLPPPLSSPLSSPTRPYLRVYIFNAAQV